MPKSSTTSYFCAGNQGKPPFRQLPIFVRLLPIFVRSKNAKTLETTGFFGISKSAVYLYISIDTACISIQGRPLYAEKSAGGPACHYAKITDMLYWNNKIVRLPGGNIVTRVLPERYAQPVHRVFIVPPGVIFTPPGKDRAAGKIIKCIQSIQENIGL